MKTDSCNGSRYHPVRHGAPNGHSGPRFAKGMIEGVACPPERSRIQKGGECAAMNVALNAIPMSSARREPRRVRHCRKKRALYPP